MNNFNNIRFMVDFCDENYDTFKNKWVESGVGSDNNGIKYDPNTHGLLPFKIKTQAVEFIKCPVNPQQTYYQYIKLNKKPMNVNEVLELVVNFYKAFTKIEEIIGIPDDNDTIRYMVHRMEKQYFNWGQLLGDNKYFKEMIETTTNGFKTYQLVFKT